MIYTVVFAPEAEDQIVALYRHIAMAASPSIALKFTQGVVEECQTLSTFPLRGAAHEGIRKGLRTITYKRRVTIAYMCNESTVTILGVFYGGQNFTALLEE